MTFGILETGAPPSRLRERFGSYVDMFKDLIGPDRDYAVFDVAAGDLPDPARPHQAYLVTGSPADAYSDVPWVLALGGFLRAVKGRSKLVGICFGHQMMAQAFGGRVEKSAKGWGVGLQTYAVWSPEPWMDDPAPVAVSVSHQDQVVAVPPGARVIGGNAFTPNGMLAYDDQPAISMQCHPEFSADFSIALLETRWAEATLGDQAKAAIASHAAPDDRERVGAWIRRFLG